MPVYSFYCPECGNKEESVRTMQNSGKVCKCVCGAKMNRNFSADVPHTSKEYKRPIHSDSLAIHPDQRAEHLKMFPDIRLDSQCRPIFDTFSSHQKYLDKCNLVKDRKKVKPRGKRIA